jgi:hypothetical protein
VFRRLRSLGSSLERPGVRRRLVLSWRGLVGLVAWHGAAIPRFCTCWCRSGHPEISQSGGGIGCRERTEIALSITKMLSEVMVHAFNGRSAIPKSQIGLKKWKKQRRLARSFAGLSSEKKTWHDRRDQRDSQCS